MEKIRKTMRREDGFTLVELLAVIVILGIILAIAIPAIGNVISRSETKAIEASQDMAVDAARLYVTANYDKVKDWTFPYTGLTITELKTAGYLENIDEDHLGDADYVEVTQVDAGETDAFNYTYEYKSAS